MSHDPFQARNHGAPQSIPLQDLSRPPDPFDEAISPTSQSFGGRARALLGARSGFSPRTNTSGRYERVLAGSSHDALAGRSRALDPPAIVPPESAHQRKASFDDDDLSPINMGDFQAAMGSVGLSFGSPATSASAIPHITATSPSGRPQLGIMTDHDVSTPPLAPSLMERQGSHESEEYFAPRDDDRSPLTDPRFLQPISGSQLPSPSGQRHERQSSMSSRLGDDLPGLDRNTPARHRSQRLSAYSTSSFSRSLSVSGAANPLTTAGTMIRKMSQRVVNLSNEPEIVEQYQMYRRASTRHLALEEAPSFPHSTEYAHDEAFDPPSPIEKAPPMVSVGMAPEKWQQQTNPLKGKSLGIFAPESPVRLWLCELLVNPWTEPFILVLILLQTIILTIDAAPSIGYGGRVGKWGHAWVDEALLPIFAVYTLELVAKVIVSGFIFNAHEYSTLDRSMSRRKALMIKFRDLFALEKSAPPKPHAAAATAAAAGLSADFQPSIIRSFTVAQFPPEERGHSRHAQRIRLARRAFLRHSFNRLDFVAICSFWMAFVLNIVGVELDKHVFVFTMLSCLRILRLLGLTSGTSVILRSLKKAAPLLVHVAFLIGFFWLLFAIVGVQSFKSSFRRTCVWFGDNIALVRTATERPPQAIIDASYAQNFTPSNIQFCGGYLDINGSILTYKLSDYVTPSSTPPKGFTCPAKSMCIEGSNPYNGTVSFDNVAASLELVFVIMSSNTFSDLLYYTTDSDYLAGGIFFAFGIVILSLWLTNLLVAVITSSFQIIREESKASAFSLDDSSQIMEDDDDDDGLPQKKQKQTPIKRLFDQTYWLWILIIIFGLVVQSLRAADSSRTELRFIDGTETVVTLLLLLEIAFRFASDWRNFHRKQTNLFDLFIAIVTSLMQLPPIHNSGMPYAWLTAFQIVRIYRVVLAVTLTRALILTVLGNVSGILNLIVFVFLVTFIASLFAVQIFRGEFPATDWSGNTVRITFSNIYNAFLGMYQVLSSENWTIMTYNATQYDFRWNTAWIGAIFFVLWFIFGNFIILNMFIAVIQENFDVSEDEKRLQQVKAFLQQRELSGSSHSTFSLAKLFSWRSNKVNHRDPVDYGPATIDMFKDTVVHDFLDEQMEAMDEAQAHEGHPPRTPAPPTAGRMSVWWDRLWNLLQGGEPNPFYTRLRFSRPYEDLDTRTLAKEIHVATEQRKLAQRQYLQTHPQFNVSLYLFKPDNPIRRLCQRMVGPGQGSSRYEGVDPSKRLWYPFSVFIYLNIVAMVVLACIATPLYQRNYFEQHGYTIRNWFLWTDLGFAAVFTIEAAIKVIADGFFFTPNAYFRGSWGFIDGVVLLTLWLNVVTALSNLGAVSRAVGAFKALRALRLLNISDSTRDTFHSVMILGGWKVISAAFVSLSLLIPFALLGTNIFSGQFEACNDGGSNITSLADCVGEYNSTPYNNNWPIVAPRQVSNPYYSFDNFGSSLFILFQIVSLEGWVDVMWSGMSITGVGRQPINYNSQGSAMFFVIFNLLGSIFILTLFVSVFMRNYTEQTGVAFLTAEQRSWLELKKLLRQISPSKRPNNTMAQRWRTWCYRIAMKKHGRWQKTVTGALVLHLVLLILEFYPEVPWWETTRDAVFLAITLIVLANIAIRFIGLTWKRVVRSSWDLYAILSASGTFVLTVLDFSRYRQVHVYTQSRKLFLVSMALLLIPRNNQLDQLFKTAAASLSAIGSLLATWIVMFLVFAIALTQTLGLTKFGSQAKANLNFRSVTKALILLFRMSCGEGWNSIMEDYASNTSPFCVASNNFYDSDCGSAAWARALFIAWNILSMYIFVSMFVSLIFESFAYVYQQSSGLSVVSRDELRRFKQAWSTFDPNGSGYITKEMFPKLLGELSGVFEMCIYNGDHTVRQILEHCTVDVTGPDPPAGVVHGVDLARLNERLRTINVPEIQRRRAKLNLFSTEVLVGADPERGIHFTNCLMVLAHHNIITDSKSLRLEEFLRRRHKLQRVNEDVRRRVVISFFDTLHWSREFRRCRELKGSARMVTIPQFAVPEIFVDDQNAQSTPGVETLPPLSPGAMSPVDMAMGSPQRARANSQALSHSPGSSIGGARRRGESVGSSPSRSDFSYGPSPVVQPRRPSDLEEGGSFSLDPVLERVSLDGRGARLDGGTSSAFERRPSALAEEGISSRSHTTARHRRGQSSNSSNQRDLVDFDNSAWGESIKRSFTLRRHAGRGRAALGRLEEA